MKNFIIAIVVLLVVSCNLNDSYQLGGQTDVVCNTCQNGDVKSEPAVSAKAKCDDGDPCTSDSEVNGQCVNVDVFCPEGFTCGTTGECIKTPKSCGDCNDNNLCTVDKCDPNAGNCIHTPKSCDDGDPATTDSCDPLTGDCTHVQINCADDDPCTKDYWDMQADKCQHVPLCKDDEVCVDGVCIWKCTENADCGDGNPCTMDACEPSGLCSHKSKTCDDNNACTQDTCNHDNGGCINSPMCGDGTVCDDGLCVAVPSDDECNGNEDCNDGNACTTDSCTNGKCKHTAVVCKDGEVCDPASGKCVELEVPDCPGGCSDKDPCTIDSCEDGECVSKPLPCGFGTVCVSGQCVAENCGNTPAFVCNDKDPCTQDFCGEGGCIFAALPCGPGTVCVDAECVLDPKLCLGDIYCDDGNPCTDELCFFGLCLNAPKKCGANEVCAWPTGQCVPVETPDCLGGCDDSNPATLDYCQGGECVHSQPVDCGEGTQLNEATGLCEPIPVPDPQCQTGTKQCHVINQQISFMICLDGDWFMIEKCGPVGGTFVCLDDQGCIQP